MNIPEQLTERLRRYLKENNARVLEPLGDGKDGYVVAMLRESPARPSAVKIFFQTEVYEQERDVYFRLQLNDVHVVQTFNIPELIDFNDTLSAIEISIVQAPYIVDFASAYLDEPPDFEAGWIEEARSRIYEMFDDRAEDVLAALDHLQCRHGIWYLDARPGNINVGDG